MTKHIRVTSSLSPFPLGLLGPFDHGQLGHRGTTDEIRAAVFDIVLWSGEAMLSEVSKQTRVCGNSICFKS